MKMRKQGKQRPSRRKPITRIRTATRRRTRTRQRGIEDDGWPWLFCGTLCDRCGITYKAQVPEQRDRALRGHQCTLKQKELSPAMLHERTATVGTYMQTGPTEACRQTRRTELISEMHMHVSEVIHLKRLRKCNLSGRLSPQIFLMKCTL